MTLEEFMTALRAGEIEIATGTIVDGVLYDGAKQLDASDIEMMTAEAFNLDVFGDGTDITWDEAMIQVAQAFQASTRHNIIYETRAADYATRRERIANSYRRLIIDASQRILRRERADVMRQAEKMLTRRAVIDFKAWLLDFYRDHEQFVERAFLPIYMAMGDQITDSAAEQIGMVALTATALQTFIEAYTHSAGMRYVMSSQGQINDVMDKALAEKGDPLEAIQQRFDEWDQTRPDKIAMTNTVRVNNATAKETWTAAGIQRFVWRTRGQETCPYCKALDGRTVGLDSFFLSANEDFQPEGADRPLRPHSHVGHPPSHLGCDCAIEPA